MSQPITVMDVKVILTQPNYSRLVVVKMITSEPGLYGLGCATFTQRCHAVQAAFEGHIIPFMSGKTYPASKKLPAWRWSTATGAMGRCSTTPSRASIWRCGTSRARWRICRSTSSWAANAARAPRCTPMRMGAIPRKCAIMRKFQAQGYRYIRIQMGGYGGKADEMVKPEGAPAGAYFDPRAYTRNMLKMMEYVRSSG